MSRRGRFGRTRPDLVGAGRWFGGASSGLESLFGKGAVSKQPLWRSGKRRETRQKRCVLYVMEGRGRSRGARGLGAFLPSCLGTGFGAGCNPGSKTGVVGLGDAAAVVDATRCR